MAVGGRSFCALALVLAACSGAGNQDLFEGTSEADDTSSNEPAPSTSTTPGGKDPGSTSPTPAPTGAKDGGTPTPTPTPAACTQEVEPNDDMNRATPFKTSLCGKIDSTNDVDYGAFVVPQDATTVSVKHSEKNGRALYRYFLGPVSVGVQNGQFDAVPGATYTVQIRLDRSGNGLPTYELDVSFK